MQPQQSCPRCHSTEFRTYHVSLTLISDPQKQISINGRQDYIENRTIVGVVNLFATVLLLFFLISRFPANFDLSTYSISIPFGIFLFIVAYADITFLFDFFPKVLAAPKLNGLSYECRKCSLVWYEWPPVPVQTFAHIARSKTKYNQCNLIEGVVCPNPACGSLNVVSSRYWKALTRNVIYTRYIRTGKVRSLLRILTVLAGFQLALSLIPQFDIFPFYLVWLFLIILLSVKLNYYWINKTGHYIAGRNYMCPDCQASWSLEDTEPKFVPIKIKWYEEEVAIGRQDSSPIPLANNLLNLAYYKHEYQRNVKEASALYEESLTITQKLDYKPLLAHCYNHIGSLLIEEGQIEQSLPMLEQSAALYVELNSWYGYIGALDSLAVALLRGNQPEKAIPLFKQVIAIARKAEGYRPRNMFWGIQGLAEAALKQGQPVMATRLYAAIQTLRDTTEEKLSPLGQTSFDKLVNDVRSQLDSFSFVAAWREGSQLTLDQAIEYACSLTAAPLG